MTLDDRMVTVIHMKGSSNVDWETHEKRRKHLEKMTTPELRAELETETRKHLLRELDNLPDVIHRIVTENAEAIILAHLGVKRSTWDGWEADHCNGRRTELANSMGAEAVKTIRAALPQFISQLAESSPLNKGIHKAARAEYKEQFSRILRDEINRVAQERAAEMARIAVEDAASPKAIHMKGSDE